MTQDGNGYIIQTEAPRGPLTARNVEDFVQCPRKYLLSFMATRAGTRDFIGGPAALHRAVRAALLEMYAAGSPETWQADRLLQTFEENWDGTSCRDSLEEETLHDDGVRMLQGHLTEPIQMGPGARTDVRLEKPVGEHTFVAVADVVDPANGRVIRLTTSRRPLSPGELVQDTSWGLLCLLSGLELETDSATCAMADLRKNRIVEFSLDGPQREALQDRLLSLARGISRERAFDPRKGKQCRWCRSRPDCPAFQK